MAACGHLGAGAALAAGELVGLRHATQRARDESTGERALAEPSRPSQQYRMRQTLRTQLRRQSDPLGLQPGRDHAGSTSQASASNANSRSTAATTAPNA